MGLKNYVEECEIYIVRHFELVISHFTKAYYCIVIEDSLLRALVLLFEQLFFGHVVLALCTRFKKDEYLIHIYSNYQKLTQ